MKERESNNKSIDDGMNGWRDRSAIYERGRASSCRKNKA